MKRFAAFLVIAILTFNSCKKSDPAPTNDVNQADRSFIQDASLFNAAAVQINQWVDTTSTDTLIRRLARQLATDHLAIRQTFTAIAGSFAFYSRDSLDAAHVALRAAMDTLSGRSFDSVYIHSQKNDHEAAVVLFKKETDSGLNIPIRQFAQSVLPLLQSHLKSIDSLAKLY